LLDPLNQRQGQPSVILDALHSVTTVKVLSNPSPVVINNQKATLQVGDVVPVSTGSANALTTSNTIVNTIDYRNIGIILQVSTSPKSSGRNSAATSQPPRPIGPSPPVCNDTDMPAADRTAARRTLKSTTARRGLSALALLALAAIGTISAAQASDSPLLASNAGARLCRFCTRRGS
jgi:hypothetical protein